MKLSCLTLLLFCLGVGLPATGLPMSHLIFSVTEDIPMGWEKEVLRKNYYINMGANHGIKKGSQLTVYRMVSKRNPYDNKKRVNYKVPIGTLEVIHTEKTSAIGSTKKLFDSVKDPVFEINNFMVGDYVEVKIN